MLMTSAFLQLIARRESAVRLIVDRYRCSERLQLPITLNYLKTCGVDPELVDALEAHAQTPYEARILAALVLLEIFGSRRFVGREGLVRWLARQKLDVGCELQSAAHAFACELKRREALAL